MANNDSVSSLGQATPADEAVVERMRRRPAAERLPAEILLNIFSKINSTSDLLNCIRVNKTWARNGVNTLWWRPTCSTWDKHTKICRTLSTPQDMLMFAYKDFVKRLNLTCLADQVNDGSVLPLRVCTNVERLTLTNCHPGLTDTGLVSLLENNTRLLALDVSVAMKSNGDPESDTMITEQSIDVLAARCHQLQGLNISGCLKVTNESLIKVAEQCRKIKRLKLNYCSQVTDDTVMAFAMSCPNILELDLQNCKLVTDAPITAMMRHGQSLRELRLAGCELITDAAFLNLPNDKTYEHLRILDLTSCNRITDRTVEKIIHVAPRLRNLVLAKCRNITDVGVNAISALGKNLHYLHLGHCSQITDEAVKNIVAHCGRIRYIDLGCCTRLTDDSVMLLARLPKLRRIGLVKCTLISDASVYALAQSQRRAIEIAQAMEYPMSRYYAHGIRTEQSCLERVHLSYCTKLTLKSIITLLNHCPRLTHLSLTGVDAFLREDFDRFCREAPEEFNAHQRQVFCVFSGTGVTQLREYLNQLQPPAGTGSTTENEDEDASTLSPPMEVDDDDATMVGASTNVPATTNANAGGVPPPPPIHPTTGAPLNSVVGGGLPSSALLVPPVQNANPGEEGYEWVDSNTATPTFSGVQSIE